MTSNLRGTPRLVERTLEHVLPPSCRDSLLGDLAEEHARRCEAVGPRAAATWYLRQGAISAVYGLAASIRQQTSGGTVSKSLMPAIRSVLSFVAAFAIFWLGTFALIQVSTRWFAGWPATEIAQLVGCVFGVLVAKRLRVRLLAYFFAAMVAFTVAELSIHIVYGLRSAQGAPTHFAVMAAALLAVVFGALLSSHLGSRDREAALDTSGGAELAAPTTQSPRNL